MGKLKDKLARVKKQFTEGTKPSPPMDPEVKLALEIGFAYERILGEYSHQPALRYFVRLGEQGIKPITMAQLKKSAVIADKHKVDAETYVRAQFYWFHTWFKRAPKIRELCGMSGKNNAVWRLTNYLKKEGKKVYSKAMPSQQISREELDKINRQRLEQLSESWNKSHEEIITLFAESGVFDQSWLKKNEIYKRLVESEEL
jgi:hypothetical protein